MATRSAIINVMVSAVQKASRGLVRDFGEVENLQVSRKGPADFVSAADLKAEKILRGELAKARPDFGFLMEEGGSVPAREGSEGYRWIIDPLDGTHNFLHGIPHFAITVALEREGEVIAGVTYDPLRDEMYTAEKGGGAFVNGRRIRVSSRRQLVDSIVATGIPRADKPGSSRVSQDAGRDDVPHGGRAPFRLGRAGPCLCRSRPVRRLLGKQPATVGHRRRDHPRA